MSGRSLRPLVFLDEGANYYGVVVSIGLLRLVDRFGGDEGMDGVLGRGQQVLMDPAVLVLGQIRGVASCRSLGVARCRSLGVVDAGSEVRDGDFTHLDLEVRGHLRS